MTQRRRKETGFGAISLPVTGSHTLSEGAISVISVAGYAHTASIGAQVAGSTFGGINLRESVNTGSAGLISTQLQNTGFVWLPTSGTYTLAQLVNKPLYAVGASAVAPSGSGNTGVIVAAAGYLQVGVGKDYDSSRAEVLVELGTRGPANGSPA